MFSIVQATSLLTAFGKFVFLFGLGESEHSCSSPIGVKAVDGCLAYELRVLLTVNNHNCVLV